MAESAGWSALPSDLVNRVADRLLATNDVDYYMDLRAVCGAWRRATAGTTNSPDPRFRPTRWAVVDEVNYSLDASRRTRLLVNTATGRVLRRELPMLRNYYVVATTPGGFFVLADRESPHATCVLNPFTGHLVRFAAPMVADGVSAASVFGPSDAPPSLMLFCDSCRKMYMADADSACFAVYEDDERRYPSRKLGVLGIIYTGRKVSGAPGPGDDVSGNALELLSSFAVEPSELLAVYPREETGHTNRCFLVESAGEMLIIIKLEHSMEIFKMNTDSNAFEPVKSIGDRAIFLGYHQCLSVNANEFPSVDADCIYYLKSLDSPCDIYMYDLKDEKEERVSGAINAINCLFLFDADPPFTIVQLLSSYTINAWYSELEDEKRFEGVPEDVIWNAEEFQLSSFLEDLEFDDY